MRTLGVLPVVVVALVPASPAAAQTCTGCQVASFGPSTRYVLLPPLTQPGGNPRQGAAVDMNGDGFPDFLAAASGGIAVALADGSGGFGPGTLYPGPSNGSALVVADFDRDGHADVVSSTDSSPNFDIFFWRGDGNGALSPPVETNLGLGDRVRTLVTSDLDADGKPDLVVALSSGIVVLRGNGAGGFSVPQVIGPEAASGLAVADVNHDGRPDLVSVASSGVSVRIAFAGGFATPSSLPAGLGSRAVEVADVNGDGHPDLVVLNYGDGYGVGASVSVLRGNGTGAFSPAVNQPVAVKAMALAIADFNRDGRADAAVTSESNLTMLLGQADGSLLPSLTTRVTPTAIAVAADFDRDRFTDLVLAQSAFAQLFAGDGAGGLGLAVRYPLGGPPRGMAVGNFNGDAILDVAVSRDATNDVAILLGTPGGFTPGPTFPTGAKPGSLATGDLNNDGIDDLVVLADATDRVRVYIGNGAGGFAYVGSHVAGPYPGGVAVGDLNSDGKLDIVVGNAQDGEALYWFLGNGDGTFAAAQSVVANSPARPLVADIDQDGNADVLTVPYFFPLYLADTQGRRPEGAIPTLELFLGNGSGALQPPVEVPVAVTPDPTTFALGDMDGDDDLDLVVATPGGVYLLLNDGAGGFGPPADLNPGHGAGEIALADVNGDGRLDVITGGIQVLTADAFGGFVPSPLFAGGSQKVIPLDLDGDSRPELVFLSFAAGGVELLWNTNCRTRRFRIATDLPTCNTPGQPFATQPVVHAIDDGGNRVQCESGNVSAVFVPGAFPPGATILGTATIPFVAGIASFTDLAVDLPGSYDLKYERPTVGAPRVVGRNFSQGMSVAIGGPAVVPAGATATYSATPGFQWYDWTLDATPVSTAQSTSLTFPALGSHDLAVSARQDGCTVGANVGIVVGPVASATGGSVTEGDSGTTGLPFSVSLSAASTLPVTVSYATADVTALAGSDYVAGSGTVSFAPGETSKPVVVSALGDIADEPDESLALQLSGATNAVPGAAGTGRIRDDDGSVDPIGLPRELVHGFDKRESLEGNGQEQSRWYVMRQQAGHSYEVVVDAVSGDVTPIHLERLDAANAVVQAATSVGGGASVSLRFENVFGVDVVGERFQVRSGSCSASCGPEAGYRIRAYDTTSAIARFNNQLTQITILVLQNVTGQTITGHVRYHADAGTEVLSQAFSIQPHRSLIVNTSALPGLPGQRGTLTVASDAPYGVLSGKTTAVEPALGFTFDTPLRPRPR